MERFRDRSPAMMERVRAQQEMADIREAERANPGTPRPAPAPAPATPSPDPTSHDVNFGSPSLSAGAVAGATACATDAAGRALQEAQLASILDLDLGIAQEALGRCGYCFEVAVDVACDLAASGFRPGASSSGSAWPAMPLAPAPQARGVWDLDASERT